MGEEHKNRLNEMGWTLLLEEIKRGNVIPVIGKELLTIKINGKQMLLKEYILREMASRLGIEYETGMDFSHLSYEYNPMAWKKIDSEPYYMTKCIVEELYSKVKTPPLLFELLSIKNFNYVITTSFDDFVFKAMQEIKGKDNVKQLCFNKNASEKDEMDEDITGSESNFVYHIFGRISPFPHEFVLTDDDLLEFMHYWLDGIHRPKKLSNLLQDKYLLVIGCNYPNWLFRFFFHSLKYPSVDSIPQKIGMLADSKLDTQLIDFLSRMNAGIYDDALNFIQELIQRWKAFDVSISKDVINRKKIFISYANEDYSKAKSIVDQLSKEFDVWFDKKSLDAGDDYAKMIKDNIQQSDAFIPILSNTTAKPDRRFFKREWKWASDESEFRFPNKFIYPIRIDDVNMNNPLFSIFSKLHTVDFENNNSSNNIVENIMSEINLQ